MRRSLPGWLIALLILLPPAHAGAAYSNLFVFGDSLSDSGNNAIVFGPNNVTQVPISGNSFIPTFPYASGHYTNGQVWAQDVASALGLSANPSLAGGTDWAFGGARTGPVSGSLFSPFPPSLLTQVAFFLAQNGNVAPSDALYVVEGGGNNVRDALVMAGGCGMNLACINAIVLAAALGYAGDIAAIDAELEAAGAKHLVVWNTPDIGKTPAALAGGALVSGLATEIAAAMNLALLSAIGGDPDVQLFDIFGLVDSFVADPGAFGLDNATDACAQFVTCDPSKFAFWDGIHPTSAGHLIIADAFLRKIPEPATLLLIGLGFIALVPFVRR